jgi:hypothetical protein
MAYGRFEKTAYMAYPTVCGDGLSGQFFLQTLRTHM